jgi:transcription antitermination factor NusG
VLSKAEGLLDVAATLQPVRPEYWLIVIAESLREFHAVSRIEDLRLGIDPYLPTVCKQRRAGRNRLRDVVEPMYRPYFFVPATLTDQQFNAVRCTRGVLDYLIVDGYPAIVRNAEVEKVRARERQIELLRQQRLSGCGNSQYVIGEAVRISIGFTRLSGNVHTIDARGRVGVKLAGGVRLFGRDVVAVELTHIQPDEE